MIEVCWRLDEEGRIALVPQEYYWMYHYVDDYSVTLTERTIDNLYTANFGRLECGEGTVYSFDASTAICLVSNDYSAYEYSYKVDKDMLTFQSFDGAEISVSYSVKPDFEIKMITMQQSIDGINSHDEYNICFAKVQSE